MSTPDLTRASESDNDSTHESDSDCVSEMTCCSKCLGCNLALDRIKYYRDIQADGTYHYALNGDYGGFCLWQGVVPCKIFADLDRYADLNPLLRSDPCMLAFVDLYSPMDIYIVQSERPEFMSLSEYDGYESVNVDLVQSKMKVENARVAMEKNRTMLSNAQKLAAKLLAHTVDTESSVMVEQLLQLLNAMAVQ